MSNEVVKDHLLCAFLDEELSQDELDNLLELLECDEIRARASRQSLAGSVMSNKKTLCVDISSSVRAAIQQEGPLQGVAPATFKAGRRTARRWFAGKQVAETSRAPRRRWQVPAAGVALAASVAVAAVVVVRPSSNELNRVAQQVAAAPQASGNPAISSAVNVEQLLANAQQQSINSNARMRPSLTNRANGAQLVAAGSSTATRNGGGRELVIAAPAQDRPVSAQWALVDNQSGAAQQLASQQRLREQLNTYLINHARHGGGTALTGSLAYARVAARPAQNTVSE
ncbi:MAG: hypothetical protein ACSHXK_05055 [Oceanococcus sp.]